MKKREKEEKSVQINNLKWHSKWRSASPFPATVSCSQTGSLYISIRELVSGETLWSRWLFFSSSVRGSVGYVYSRGLLQEETEVWWLECAGRDLQLVMITWWMLRAWGQMCVRGEQGGQSGGRLGMARMCLSTILWKNCLLLTRMTPSGISRSFQMLLPVLDVGWAFLEAKPLMDLIYLCVI